MTVSTKQKRYLRSLAHSLKPVVMLSIKGLTDTVMVEIDKALKQHELIKVRISNQERGERIFLLHKIASETSADLVQIIGHIGAFYRPSEKAVIQLPY